MLAVLLDLTLALAVIGIAALLFPILERTHAGAAMSYVGVRILEGVIIVVGAISSLLLLTSGRDYVDSGGTNTGDHDATGEVLLQASEWTDSLGTAVVFGISALIVYGLMYRSEVVPRWLASRRWCWRYG